MIMSPKEKVASSLAGLANALNNRPVRVVGFLTAVHSFIVGLGLFVRVGGGASTLLYEVLGTDLIRNVFSLVLMISGALLMFAFARNNPKTIRFSSILQSTVWLFATITYITNGEPMVALTIFLLPTLVASYLAYAHSNRIAIMAYDRTPQARIDTANEDQL